MEQPQYSAQQSQRSAIKTLISALGTSKVLSQIKNSEILSYLTASSQLTNFLFQISSRQLFDVAKQKQQEQLEQERANRYRINVLDLAVHQLVKHCRNYGLIKFGIVQGNHHAFGMMLVHSVPDKFYVGSKSHHYNRAREIQMQYGIVNHQESSESESNEDEGDRGGDDADQQYVRDHNNQQQQGQDQGPQQEGDYQQNQSSQFINDEVQESNYQQSQEQVQEQEDSLIQSQQHQATKTKKKKKKKISKQRVQLNKKNLGTKKKVANQGEVGTRRSSRFAYKDSQQQEQIFLQDYQIQLPNSRNNRSKQTNQKKNYNSKQGMKNQQEQLTTSKKNKKKLSLDSDQEKS